MRLSIEHKLLAQSDEIHRRAYEDPSWDGMKHKEHKVKRTKKRVKKKRN